MRMRAFNQWTETPQNLPAYHNGGGANEWIVIDAHPLHNDHRHGLFIDEFARHNPRRMQLLDILQ